MAVIETEGLILRSYNLADADKVVVLLAREHGIIRGVAKGAKRLNSKFGSSLEPLSIVRVSFHQKESSELVALEKIELLRSNFREMSHPEFLQKFSYLIDILISVSPPNDPNEVLYRMVRASIDAAAASGSSLKAIGVYFELWILKLSGSLPDWNRCSVCGRRLDASEGAGFEGSSRYSCSACFRGSFVNMRPLMGTALRLSPSEFEASAREKEVELDQLSSSLKKLISSYVGRELKGEVSLTDI